MRAQDTLQRIHDELQLNPTAAAYAGSSAELAIQLNKPISQKPQQFITITPDTRGVIVAALFSSLDDTQIKSIKDFCIDKSFIAAASFDSIQQEVLVSRADQLSLGEVLQGDIEDTVKATGVVVIGVGTDTGIDNI